MHELRFHERGPSLLTQDQQFQQGYDAGYTYYVTTCAHLPILETGLCTFIVATMLSVRHARRWNAGAIVGWVAALLDEGRLPPAEPTRLSPIVEHKDFPPCQ